MRQLLDARVLAVQLAKGQLHIQVHCGQDLGSGPVQRQASLCNRYLVLHPTIGSARMPKGLRPHPLTKNPTAAFTATRCASLHCAGVVRGLSG